MTARPDTALAERLQLAADAVDAPDVVFAWSERGHRTIVITGTAPAGGPRQHLHYEIGSASKTFLGLLLADLAAAGVLDLDTPARDCLPSPPGRSCASAMITLRHLISHTSGLPGVPRQPAFYRHVLSGGYSNPYADFTHQRLLAAFHRHGNRARPGTSWRYSNFATAVLAHALERVTGTAYADLLTRRILRPMQLRQTRLAPGPPGTDAQGHRRNGITPAPPIRLGAVAPTGAVRATPADLLTYLEAHLTPEASPLCEALQLVRTSYPVPGPRRAPARSLTWFLDRTDRSPVYFHGGSTFGQTAYLGFRPAGQVALAALATRHHDRRNTLINTAHALLTSTAA
ncbi:beta-lactamase family protein [Saccharopolyspora indica]|uniref:serine hydrolase domain-containing protein n=1 Tax=Saccharopolyspora indica TaxID=1229659 RepID=UPI0022EA40D7|nr:serine hydrolase domain-containing protein [Saccharopolyspora indica]MDA3645148.1 serine hydrolase [Saccharopolyspora indica]